MRLLVIDNTLDPTSWGSSDLARFGRLVPGTTVFVRRAPHEDLPESPRSFDRIIVSGSRTSCLEDAPWIAGLHDFVRRAIDEGKPYLGVCYGHQTLIRALGEKSQVRKAARPEYGWTRIELLERSRLFEGLPGEFHTFSSHQEEVSRLPAGMTLLARSEDCPIQACELADKPVFGIQFHPERDAEGADRSFREWKKKGEKQLLHPSRTSELYDAKVGETIFGNFLRL